MRLNKKIHIILFIQNYKYKYYYNYHKFIKIFPYDKKRLFKLSIIGVTTKKTLTSTWLYLCM